jgi:N-acetyltransferase
MLVHAFDVLGVNRVVLNTDARNERSRNAIARIGATFEGVLHGFRYGVEGTPRDTATFAIPVREWPDVRARLEARLNP